MQRMWEWVDHIRFPESPSLEIVNSIIEKAHAQIETEQLQIHVVTPVVGGSSKPGKVNKEMPIRSGAVRGNLRFWWRATRGASFTTAKELFAREELIFGSTNKASSIKIWVMCDSKSLITDQTTEKYIHPKTEREATRLKSPLRGVSYAAFPFNSPNDKHDFIKDPFSFNLHIEYAKPTQADGITKEELKKELHAALWGWINFGGVGARTRRGFGSLYCAKFSPEHNEKNLKQWLQKQVTDRGIQLLSSQETREWATLNGITVQHKSGDQIYAWSSAVEIYEKFRKKATMRNGRPLGRSFWPEADSLRSITGMGVQIREKDHVTPHPRGKQVRISFPRAQFGLPIIFEFKDKGSKGNKSHYNDKELDKSRDPYKTQLMPQLGDRLASPIIVKSIAISQKLGISSIVRLNQPAIMGLKLEIVDSGPKEHLVKVKDRIKQHQKTLELETCIYPTQYYDDNPLRLHQSKKVQPNAIEAFLSSEEVTGWIEQSSQQQNKPDNRNPRQR